MSVPKARAGRPIRLVIADDHDLFRAGVRMLIEEESDIEFSGECDDPGRGWEAARRWDADVLLLDVEGPGCAGFESLLRGGEEKDRVKTVALTSSEDPGLMAQALDLGAFGVVPKQASWRELTEAIRCAHRGLRRLSPEIERYRERRQIESAHPRARSLGRPAAPGARQSEWAGLTNREREVATLVSEGLRYQDIAEKLLISEHTVKNHARHIFGKLGVKSRIELALLGNSRRIESMHGRPPPLDS